MIFSVSRKLQKALKMGCGQDLGQRLSHVSRRQKTQTAETLPEFLARGAGVQAGFAGDDAARLGTTCWNHWVTEGGT